MVPYYVGQVHSICKMRVLQVNVLQLLLASIVMAAENVTWREMGDVKPGYEMAVLAGRLSWYQALLECARVSHRTGQLPVLESDQEREYLKKLVDATVKGNFAHIRMCSKLLGRDPAL